MHKHALLGAGLFLSLNAWATGGPILLSSFADSVSFFSPKNAAAEVQFILQLGEFPQPLDPATGLGAGIWWGEGGDGYVDFTAESTTGFFEFASIATNGIDDEFALVFAFANGNPEGYVEDEYFLLGRNPDWIGYQIDLIRLSVSDIRFEPRVFEDFDYYVVYAGLKYEFYGTPVPEPETMMILIFGIVLMTYPAIKPLF